MNPAAFLQQIRRQRFYRGQIVHVQRLAECTSCGWKGWRVERPGCVPLDTGIVLFRAAPLRVAHSVRLRASVLGSRRSL